MKLLFAYHAFLMPETNAGCLRLLEIIRILHAEGHSITFLAYEDRGNRTPLEALGVECICDQELGLSLSQPEFEKFLHKRQFHAAVLVQYFVYNYYAPYLKAFLPSCHRILDTVDMHFLRLRRQSELQAHMKTLAKSVEREEKRALRDADSIWIVTETEQEIVRPLSGNLKHGLFVIPTLHPVLEERMGYADREGMTFIGSYNHAPNVDAVGFLVDDILPPLRSLLPNVPITIAGSNMPAEFQQYASQDMHLHMVGFVPDHRALLASCRVGLAPLRFGAGMKGKIGEFMACGLPCVTTSIGAEGMALVDGQNILIANDPAEYAKSVAQLYNDAILWQTVSDMGIQYIEERVTPQAITPTVIAAIAFAALPYSIPPPQPLTWLRSVFNMWCLRHPASRKLMPAIPLSLTKRIKSYLLSYAWIASLRSRFARS